MGWSIKVFLSEQKSNVTRKDFIVDEVIDCVWKLVYEGAEKLVVGAQRLVMKSEPTTSVRARFGAS